MRLRNLRLFTTLAQSKIPLIQILSMEKVDLASLDNYSYNKIRRDSQILQLETKLDTDTKLNKCLDTDRLEKFTQFLITEKVKMSQ